jgi:hypothetical protein
MSTKIYPRLEKGARPQNQRGQASNKADLLQTNVDEYVAEAQ